MKILITGSKGLIGSALCVALQRLGIQVVGIDLKEGPGFPQSGDILDFDLLKEKISGCHGVVHLAAISRVITGEKNPALCWETNVKGTSNVVHAALNSECEPWVIYASSREVYGQQKTLPVKESDLVCPVNIYGESKAEAERIILGARNQGLSTAILRFSNVYGSVHDYADRVIPAFCIAAIKQTEMRIDGMEQLFDFTYIDDVVHGILSTIFLLSQPSKVELPPIHLTTGTPSSLGQVAAIANQAGGNGAKMVEAPCRSYDVAKFYGDPSLAWKILRWKACVGVEDGIHRLINHYRLFFQASEIVEVESALCLSCDF
ncbi:MAG: NAD-dependent epimerase/dehydratase family protein [Chlamydiales bacterium]